MRKSRPRGLKHRTRQSECAKVFVATAQVDTTTGTSESSDKAEGRHSSLAVAVQVVDLD